MARDPAILEARIAAQQLETITPQIKPAVIVPRKAVPLALLVDISEICDGLRDALDAVTRIHKFPSIEGDKRHRFCCDICGVTANRPREKEPK